MNINHPLYRSALQRLIDDFTAMLGTEASRSVVFDYPIYAQWADFGVDAGLHVEMTGPEFLSEGHLSSVDMAKLHGLGLKGPDHVSPNFYWRTPGVWLDLHLAAAWLLEALVDAYHVPEDVVLTTILKKVPPHSAA